MTALAPPGTAQAVVDRLWPRPDDSPQGLLARQCAADLRAFIRQAWPIVEPATEFVPSWHIDCVAEHLQAVSAGEIPRLIINQPPRTMKSLTAAVFWPSWEWLTRPHVRWLFASYAQDFAYRDSLKMRRLIRTMGGRQDGSLFQRIGYQGVLRLLGRAWALERDQDAKSKYETTDTGMRFATGVGGMATGEGGDRIVVDDPVNARRARSEKEREAANVWWDETMTTRFNNAQAAAVIVMQRLHENDLTGHLLARDPAGWHHLCLPAEYNPTFQFTYPAQAELPSGRVVDGDPRAEPGELLDPVRLDRAVLARRRRDLGSYGYAGQYDQNPVPAEGGMFKKAWWRRRWTPGFETHLHLGWDHVIQSWDMRFGDSKKASASYVVGQAWGLHGADCYLLAQIRGQFDFVTTQHVVRALTAFRPDAHRKLVEDKANGPAIISSLQREIGGFVPQPVDGSKEARAAAVTPWAESGNLILPDADTIPCPAVYVDDDGIEHDLTPTTVQDFIDEHAKFPLGTHDDQVDATSQAINWFNPQERSPNDPRARPPGRRRGRSITSGMLTEPM